MSWHGISKHRISAEISRTKYGIVTEYIFRAVRNNTQFIRIRHLNSVYCIYTPYFFRNVWPKHRDVDLLIIAHSSRETRRPDTCKIGYDIYEFNRAKKYILWIEYVSTIEVHFPDRCAVWGRRWDHECRQRANKWLKSDFDRFFLALTYTKSSLLRVQTIYMTYKSRGECFVL